MCGFAEGYGMTGIFKLSVVKSYGYLDNGNMIIQWLGTWIKLNRDGLEYSGIMGW